MKRPIVLHGCAFLLGVLMIPMVYAGYMGPAGLSWFFVAGHLVCLFAAGVVGVHVISEDVCLKQSMRRALFTPFLGAVLSIWVMQMIL